MSRAKLARVAVANTKLAENHTAYEKRVWEYHMGELMKTERVLEGNLCSHFVVLISLCDFGFYRPALYYQETQVHRRHYQPEHQTQ